MNTPIFLMFKDNFAWTKKCIEHIEKHTKNYDLILINNGSNDKTVSLVKSLMCYSEDRFYNFEQPIGVYSAYNTAISSYISTQKRFVVIHNDVLVTENWLEKMNKCFDKTEKDFGAEADISTVFPRTNYSVDDYPSLYDLSAKNEFIKNKECNKVFFTDRIIEEVISKTYKKGLEDYSDVIEKENRSSFKISQHTYFFCTLFNYGFFRKIGMFDEDFLNPQGGNKIFSYKSNLESGVNIHCLDTFVHHNGNTTSDGFGKNFVLDFEESESLLAQKEKTIEIEQYNKVKINTKNCKFKLAVIRDKGIGDIIMSMFILSGIKEYNQSIDISYFTASEYVNFVRGFTCVDKAIPIQDGLNIASEYDSIIDLVNAFEIFYRDDDRKKHRIDILKDIFYKKLFNIRFDVKHPDYIDQSRPEFMGGIKGEYVVVSPEASCKIRSMSHNLFYKIVEKEAAKHKVVILGKGNEHVSIENIMSGDILDLRGKTVLEDLPQIIKNSKYVYAPDSGVFHIASILGVECRSFFGSIPSDFRCKYYKNKNVIYQKSLNCSPCFDVGCGKIECMAYSDDEIEKIIIGERFS